MALTLELAPYRLKAARPIPVGASRIDAREGLWIRVTLGDRSALGDVAPLPGLSSESLGEARAALLAWASRKPSTLTEGRDALRDMLVPSASWAIGSALDELGEPERALEVSTAALIEDANEVESARRAGFAIVKLKVGPGEVARASELASRLQGSEALRLDGNRRLSLNDCTELALAVGPRLDFFEEPVPPHLLDDAIARVPLALDESLAREAPRPGAVAWVVKPTILGHARAEELAAEGVGRGIRLIVSSAFESPIGRAQLTRFAARWAPHETHGLGTAAWLGEELRPIARPSSSKLTSAQWERLG
ncbi:MAG: hypothetical protein HYV07_25650 [Deltaproteobacteria bacterium]|nr:hypothetical protein [Deltaproteobacteria bacterium]